MGHSKTRVKSCVHVILNENVTLTKVQCNLKLFLTEWLLYWIKQSNIVVSIRCFPFLFSRFRTVEYVPTLGFLLWRHGFRGKKFQWRRNLHVLFVGLTLSTHSFSIFTAIDGPFLFFKRGESSVRPLGTYSTVQKWAKKKGKTSNGDYFICIGNQNTVTILILNFIGF